MISLPCVGKIPAYEVTLEMQAALQAEHPGIDVPKQLQAFRRNLEAQPHRQGVHEGMPKRINAWLSRAIPSEPDPVTPTTRAPMTALVRTLRDSLVILQLIPEGFDPVGLTEKEQVHSLRAKATLWPAQKALE